MPHPNGRIKVGYVIEDGKLTARINLPGGLAGEWQFQGKTQRLAPGENMIRQQIE